MVDSDDLLDKSTEEIVAGLDGESATENSSCGEPAADMTLNGRVKISSVARAERAEQLDDIAIDREEPSLKVQGEFERRVVGLLEALVQLSWLGVLPMVAMVYWYQNWTPVYGFIAAVVWASVTAIVLHNMSAVADPLDQGKPRKAARLNTLGHCVVFVPALLIFAASFLMWAPALTGQLWAVRLPWQDQVRLIGPGEWLAAPPFVSYIRGVKQNQDQVFDLVFATADEVPMTCRVRAHLRFVAGGDALRRFIVAHPDPDRYLRDQTREPLRKLARRMVGGMTFGDLARAGNRFSVEGVLPLITAPVSANHDAGGQAGQSKSAQSEEQKAETILELKALEFSDFVAPANADWSKKGGVRLTLPLGHGSDVSVTPPAGFGGSSAGSSFTTTAPPSGSQSDAGMQNSLRLPDRPEPE